MNEIPDTTWLERVKIEAEELETKVNKLGAFIEGEAYRALNMDHRVVLGTQLMAMCSYLACLKHRMLLAEPTSTEGENDDNDTGC
jgi:hypothetical protein